MNEDRSASGRPAPTGPARALPIRALPTRARLAGARLARTRPMRALPVHRLPVHRLPVRGLPTAAAAALRSLVSRGRPLADVFVRDVLPTVTVRDLETLRAQHGGQSGDALADSLGRAAAAATATIGGSAGALAAVEFTAPPALLAAPAQLIAETLAVGAIETRLVGELHEVYGARPPGNASARTLRYALSWASGRGIETGAPGALTLALGVHAKRALRQRLMRLLGRHLVTLGPLLTGAAAGAALNRRATLALAADVAARLRATIPPST